MRLLSRLALVVFIAIAGSTHRSSLADDPQEPVVPLPVGEKAIDFELPIVGEDTYLELSSEYKQGHVVVIVLRGYPGYQCALCSSQVGAMINRARALSERAHRVILVYPGEPTELERHADKFMNSRSLPKPLVLVRDPGMKMVDAWGLRWNAPRETAYPATYIIKSNGRVAWSKISDSHAGRTTADEILRQLKKL